MPWWEHIQVGVRENPEALRWEHISMFVEEPRVRSLAGDGAREEVRGPGHEGLVGSGMDIGFYPEWNWSH